MNLGNEDVRDILALLDGMDADELQLQTGQFRLSLRRSGDGWTQDAEVLAAPQLSDVAGPAGADTAAPAGDDTAADAGADRAATSQQGLHAVQAPLLGTFYRAPRPGAEPYVEIGSTVEQDTVVGLIETMKLFNPVHAGVCGRVAGIPQADAKFAEQDAVLVLVEPWSGTP